MNHRDSSGRRSSPSVHICPLCEAGCGLSIDFEGRGPYQRLRIAGYADDVFSRGYVCPKGLALAQLEADPDRLRRPVARQPDGSFEPIAWSRALDLAARRLGSIQKQHGRDAVAVYFGTVAVHKYDVLLARAGLFSALRTRNWTGVSSLDTGSRFVASHLLYGSCFSTPVPDIDRTDYFLCIGANPLVSNGSMMTAPNVRGRLRSLRERGGKLVVVDPRRSETAQVADEHIAIRPGADAAFLLSLTHCIVSSPHFKPWFFEQHARGFGDFAALLKDFAPARVAAVTGIEPQRIERLAREFASAKTSVAYSRMGTGAGRHSTLCCVLVDVLNMAAGRLGEVGGWMFPTPALDFAKLSRWVGADGFDRYRSRVSRRAEVVGEIPATCLAEEIETTGFGQVRALLSYAGNPVLAVPNGRRLERALERLDFHVAIDPYINESSRHADLILPPAPHLADEHLDFFFANMAVRNVVRWSDPVVPRSPGQLCDWEILLELAQRLGSGLLGMPTLDRLLRGLRVRLKPAHLANLALRLGPYGDRFVPGKRGLSLERLRRQPEGVDLGPLASGFARRVYHPGRRIRLDAPALLEDVQRLAKELDTPPSSLLLIGRRELRSNNSWMHNVPALMTGKPRCVLLVHPEDARRLGLADGQEGELVSRIHAGIISVRVSSEMAPGVVSLPHGYGHGALSGFQRTASSHAGVSLNDWIDDAEHDPISGQAILNGVPVTLRPFSPPVNAPLPRPASLDVEGDL